VIAIAVEVFAQPSRVLFQHAVERGNAFQQRAQMRFSSQARMSAMTASLPMSLSGSWK
jgi:hypothetical protein